MPDTPWTVQRSKRRQSTTTPASRKRVRISDDVGELKARDSRSKGQKTLTQIQWVNNSNTDLDDDDPELREIHLERGERAKPVRQRTPALKKRDSTLTQMDWLGGFHVHQDDTMDDAAILAERKEHVGTAPIPQLDGAYDSPRKQRKRKSEIPQEYPRSSSPTSPERETQAYRPTGRIKSKAPAKRRRSSRIASKLLTDPEENFQYMNSALLPSTEQLDKQRSPRRQPVLEVGESVDSGVEYLLLQSPRRPQTPRQHYEIRSSQTPETLTRTTKRIRTGFEKSPSKSMGRAPLAEKSTNTILNARPQGLTKLKSPQKKGKGSPKRTKICVLKVPSRELLKKTARIEDSQRDIYSLQGTSSASDPSRHSDDLNPIKTPISYEVQTQEAVEIPPTSPTRDECDHEIPSSPPIAEINDSLPELSELLPSRRLEAALVNHEKSSEASSDGLLQGDNSIIVRDFGKSRSQEIVAAVDLPNETHDSRGASTNDEMLLDGEVTAAEHLEPAPCVSVVPEEGIDDDFGSPIANDTQFNFGLSKRASSPDLPPLIDASEVQSRQVPDQGDITPTRSHHSDALAKLSDNTNSNTETSIPTPRLIERPIISSFLTQPTQPLMDKEKAMLPPSFHPNHQHPLAKVPLNDLQHVSSSSSPLLPPVKSATQRSVHPASLPRASQMSTQEPTQNDLFLSSMPNLTQHQTQTERITIKDSDSIHLSQIPQHVPQSQGHDLRPINDSDDDMDDLDLDPSSTIHGMQSARKPSMLSRIQTGSSLRSIHPPSDPPRNQHPDLSSSSSPLPPATTSHRLGKIGHNSAIRPSVKQPAEARTTTDREDLLYDSDATTSSPISSPNPSPLKKKYDPIPGFDNETQSNYTQNGHITAAYIHREREKGNIPEWFTPDPMQIEGAARTSTKRKRI